MGIRNSDRQYPLTAIVDFTLSDLTAGTAVPAVDLPQGAVVVGGELIIDTAFDSATSDTISVGDGGSAGRYGNAVDVQSAGRTALTLTGYKYTAVDTIDLTYAQSGAAASNGAGRLIVQYVVDGRGNENQGRGEEL